MEEEERRVGVIKEELGMLRAVLLPKMADNSIAGRKKRAAGKRMSDGINGNLPLCADISPALLGPLMVDQSSTTMDKVDFGCHHCCNTRHIAFAGGEGAYMGWPWRWMGSKKLHAGSVCCIYPTI